MNAVEYNASGVVVKDIPTSLTKNAVKKVMVSAPTRGRNIVHGQAPSIYVDDGSHGSNLRNTYSHKNYNFNESPSATNHYINNFGRILTTPGTYCYNDGKNLHPTGESGGWHDYEIPYRKK